MRRTVHHGERQLRDAIVSMVRTEFYWMGERAARDAGLDADTADAVGHAFAARVMDRQLTRRQVEDALAEEVQKHAQP